MERDISALIEEHAKLAYALAQMNNSDLNQSHINILIQADLRNYRLLYGLEKVGLITEDFHTNLIVLILCLTGFTSDQITDELITIYHDKIQSYMDMPLQEFLAIQSEIAENIRLTLRGWKLLTSLLVD